MPKGRYSGSGSKTGAATRKGTGGTRGNRNMPGASVAKGTGGARGAQRTTAAESSMTTKQGTGTGKK